MLRQTLRNAGVSRTAFYSLVRRQNILPATVEKLCINLGVTPISVLTVVESENAEAKVQRIRALTDQILETNPHCFPDNIRHTLLLLEEPPIERLRRALCRARGQIT